MEPRSCDEVREHLEAWMDDDLPAAARSAVERHLASCSDCERELEDLRRIGDLVRYVVRAPRAPDILRARLVAEVRRRASSAPAARAVGAPVGAWRRLPTVAAAGLIIALAGSALTYSVRRVPHAPSAAAVAAEAVQRHVAALMDDRLIEVASTDQHTVKPWFDGRVDFSPTVPRLDSLGFRLEGGRVDRVAGRSVAALVYRRRLHVIEAFTWPAAARERATADPHSYEERGYHALHWVHDGMEFWAVSDVALEDLRSFVDGFTRAAGSDGGEGRAVK